MSPYDETIRMHFLSSFKCLFLCEDCTKCCKIHAKTHEQNMGIHEQSRKQHGDEMENMKQM